MVVLSLSISGPQFGFFGDAWQTIYQSNKACGAIEHDNIDVIKKNSNFRSAPRIVQLLNDIRPDLPQKSAIDAFDGEVVVITCEDYTGTRRTDRNFKGELPPEVLKARLDEIEAKIKRDTPNDETEIFSMCAVQGQGKDCSFLSLYRLMLFLERF